MNAENLVVWLPFDETTTQDLCGNEWTAYGNPTVSDGSLQLDGSSYLQMNGGITLGGQDFTIACKFNLFSSAGNWPRVFALFNNQNNEASSIQLQRRERTTNFQVCCDGAFSGVFTVSLDSWHHAELDYVHSTSIVYVFIDGVLMKTFTKAMEATHYATVSLGLSNFTFDAKFLGSIDNFMIYDGVALHTQDFTPPTNADYLQLRLDMGLLPAPFEFDADTARQVVNALSQEQTIHFDGNNGCYGLLPLGVLAGATTFTLEAKFSTTSTRYTSDIYAWAGIFGRDIPVRWQNDFILGVNGGKLGFWAEPKTGGSNSSCLTTSEAVVNDGAVHEVAVVSSNGAIDLYCDSELVAHTEGVNATIFDNYQIPIAIHLQMDLYEARLWSVARTQEEIFATLDGSEQGLEAYYLPEVRTDNILPDISGNENHATLYGSAHVFPFDFVFDADTVVKIDNNSQLTIWLPTIWLPFNNYPTEDLCGNWWISTTPNIHIAQLSDEEADENHSVALYLAGETDSAQGKLVLNCQGIYLGGRDFNISFDWWYGGARSFSTNFPFGLWDENYSAEGSIYIRNHERFNANWNLTSLRAFGQSTPEFNIQYRSWHSIEVQYLHPEGRLVFFCDGSGLASLEVTIPRTFFPHVEIERAAPVEHGSGFISNFKISGGEMASDCANELIYLCVLRNGVVECFPFRAYEFIDYLALAIRYDGRNWYNILRDPSDPSDERASDFYILHNETIYALTKG